MTAVPTRAELREHLIATRIAGSVATPRENNLGNFRKLSDREPLYLFGLTFDGAWTAADVLALMADRVGVNPDPAYTQGGDTIDPDATVDRLDAMGQRIATAARRRERVLVCTGHPAGVGAIHAEVARALADHGCELLTPAEGWSHRNEDGRHRELRYIGGVGMVSSGAGLNHTHSPAPMEAILKALADAGAEPPDLVVGDHGWAGAAGAAGVESVGFADCNDPALFVGEAEGRVLVAVPLDDNVLPHHYTPLAAYLLAHLPSR